MYKRQKGSWQFTDAIDSWNWSGFEGTKAVIEVYAPGERVRLLLNGRELGIKNLKNFKAIFRTSYAPGTLAAEALDESGKVLSTFSLSSGDREIHLRAVPEKPVLKANGTDLCYLPIEFADGDGTLLPAIEQPVEVLTDGGVSLVGMGKMCIRDSCWMPRFGTDDGTVMVCAFMRFCPLTL